MDGDTFDALVRRTLQDGSRRDLLRAGLAALAAAFLGTVGCSSEDGEATKKRGRAHRKPYSERAKQRDRNQVRAREKKHKNRKKKHNRNCNRVTGHARCGNTCRDLLRDPLNCGACGSVCTGGTACQNGECVGQDGDTTCSPGTPTQCLNRCVDLQTDIANCGGCGTTCQLAHASARCTGGTCAVDMCDAGYADCGDQVGPGCETNIKTDPNHCGACSRACASNELCLSSACCLPATADLQAAIDAASLRATLRLCPGTWRLASTVKIAHKDVTLIGAGAEQTILDGGGTVRVLEEAADTLLRLQDLTITRGHAAGDYPANAGGGIFNDGTLTLVGVAVTGNTAGIFGGGIYNRVGTMTLEGGSSVTGNTVVGIGGLVSGGGIYNDHGTVTLVDSSVSGNSATVTFSQPPGGGIYNYWGTVRLQGSTVSSNAAGSGGGIFNHDGSVTLEGGSSVTDNEARGTSSGGGIQNYDGRLTLEAGSRVTRNTAGSGGGIFNTGGPVMVADETIVTDNHPDNCAGATVPNCIG